MSVFILKLLAMLAMLLDHVAEVFGWTGWDVLPVNASIIRCMVEFLSRSLHFLS